MCSSDRERPVAPDIRVPTTPEPEALRDQAFDSDALIDAALEQTFPASDPISPKRITK